MLILPEIIVASDCESLVHRVADDFCEAFRASTVEHGTFNVALAGGSTPHPLYQTLARPEISKEINWETVRIFFGDERCVSADHADSNYRMARDSLLRHVPIPPAQIHRMPAERDDPETAAAEYGRTLEKYLERDDAGVPGFDLALLGVGTDGHVASLFPDALSLDVSDRWAAAERAPGNSEVMRLTVTLPVLRASRRIWFLCRGEEKAKIMATVSEEVSAFETRKLPAAKACPKNGEWRWYLDEPAASKIVRERFEAHKSDERSAAAS